MLRHVVLLDWRDGTTSDQVRAVVDALATLPARIPEIRSYHFGRDAAIAAGNSDFVVVADFDDRDAFMTYQEHPDHVAVLNEKIRPILASRAAVQFELDS